jgi:hypothetical protein
LSITEEEWVHLVKTLGSIKGIQRLNLLCTHGSHNFHPLQGVADAVNNAQSLLTLQFLALRHVDQSGIVALADALRQHPALERFIGNDFRSVQKAQQDTSLDPVLQALLACPHLCKVAIRTKCASADALRNLLHSPRLADLNLVLTLEEHWLVVAGEIQRGHCDLQNLTLTLAMLQRAPGSETIETATETATVAVKAIASAIRQDHNLLTLVLEVKNGLTDEAGVTLAEALTVNKTLQKVVWVDNNIICCRDFNALGFGAEAYEAFSAMLRINTSLTTLVLPPVERTW